MTTGSSATSAVLLDRSENMGAEFMQNQDWRNFKADYDAVKTDCDAVKTTVPIVVSTTETVPTNSSARASGIGVGTVIADGEGKKVYIVTAVAADGALTKVQIGSWT